MVEETPAICLCKIMAIYNPSLIVYHLVMFIGITEELWVLFWFMILQST